MTALREPPAALAPAALPGLGNIDAWHFVDTIVRDPESATMLAVPQGSNLCVRGWALLPDPPRVARAVSVVVSPDFWFEAEYGEPRAEVARGYGDAAAGSGFTAICKLSDVDAGPKEFVVVAFDEGNVAYEVARRSFVVVPSRELLVGQRAAAGRMHVCIDDVATLHDPAAFDGRSLRATAGDAIYVRGWAVDLEARRALGSVVGIFDGTECVLGVYGLPRDDVVAATAMPGARKCGFTLRLPTKGLLPGTHSLDVACIGADGTSYVIHRVAELELAELEPADLEPEDE
jgi:hypothetical protein